jgi:hypothetical protein
MPHSCRRFPFLAALGLCALAALVPPPAHGRPQEPPETPEEAPVPPPELEPEPAEEGAPVPPPEEPPPAEAEPVTAQPGEAPPESPGGAPERNGADDRFLPRLDFYFPEGELDLRVSRLINKVFFEGQVKYNVIEGDITAFLRYRYYGYRRITQITAFDAIEFDEVDEDVSSDFDRVRGLLTLFQWPRDYHHRTFALVELDRISSNRRDLRVEGEPGEPGEALVRTGRTNTFVRVGYQMGTADDARANAIVGETRARSERLFTAFREIGPGDAGLTMALTYGFDVGVGDFEYLKFEFEALKRFDVTPRTFVIGRLRGGTIPHFDIVEPEREVEDVDRYAIPPSDFLRLHGRDNLKGLDERMRGTEQILTTWEYFFPWFLDADRPFLRLNWQNWYWIVYAGYGTVGFDREVYTDLDAYIPDAGLGFESSFRLKKYRFFLSGIVAQALKGEGGVEARISVKSYR